MAIIQAKQLSYNYASGAQQTAVLDDLNFSIDAGDMVAIQGPSGSGKSTLLYLLGGMLHCQQGKLIIDGVDLSQLNNEQLAIFRSEKISFVFQQFHLLARATVLENILLPTHYPAELSRTDTNVLSKAKQLAGQLNISHRLDHLPNELSGGEQQRVAIARALMQGAKIILADEPTGNLDTKNTQQTLDLLRELNQQGYTVVIITHEREVAEQAQRVIHIRDGRITDDTQTQSKQVSSTSTSHQALSRLPNQLQRIPRLIWQLAPSAFFNIMRNKSRSILTMLGIIIGIASILTMVTLGQFTKEKILASYNQLGINTLLIWGYPNWQLQANDFVPVVYQGFSVENDLAPLTRIFPQIKQWSPMMPWFSSLSVEWGGNTISERVSLSGVNQDYLPITGKKLLLGDNFSAFQVDRKSNVCIIAYGIAERLFSYENPIDQVINLTTSNSSYNCRVVGVLASEQSTNSNRDPNLQIYIPYTFMQSMAQYIYQQMIYSFLVSAKDHSNVQVVGKGIIAYFQEKYGKSGDFRVSPNTLLLAQMNRFLNLFTIMLAVIAMVSLAVGGIGVTNMMLSTISERFKEIGLRKALGATDLSMRILYLLEATILCCMAGIIGLVLGVSIYETILYVASRFVKQLDFAWIFSPEATLLSLISMLVVGILSGIIPALKAERLQVVEALRSE